MPPDIREVDPNELRLPTSRPQGADPAPQGADPAKLQRQISKYGASRQGMPPLIVFEASDGELVVYNGVTRATRIAKLAPGETVPVEVIGKFRRAFSNAPKIGDVLP